MGTRKKPSTTKIIPTGKLLPRRKVEAGTTLKNDNSGHVTTFGKGGGRAVPLPGGLSKGQ